MKIHQNEHSGNLGEGRSPVHSVGMDMDPKKRNLATQLLTGMVDLERSDPAELSAMMYDEMRQLAQMMMLSERNNHTLEPTALVHEAFIRLINAEELDIRSQDHFFLLASQVMRRILIDHARSKNRMKRGGDWRVISMSIAEPESKSTIDPDELLAIDEALDRLRELDERKAKIVELRFFGGLDEETAARILGVSRSTASNDWRFARAWLMDQLGAHGKAERDG